MSKVLFGVAQPKKKIKYVQILWGLALYLPITCIGTEKVRQDVTDYKLELKISECMLVKFEFLILILKFEIQGIMSIRGVVSV